MAEPRFVTVRELATRWRLSRQAVYDLLARRQLPYTRLGGSLRVKIEDVEAYEQAGAVDAHPVPRVVRLRPRSGRPGRRRTQA